MRVVCGSVTGFLRHPSPHWGDTFQELIVTFDSPSGAPFLRVRRGIASMAHSGWCPDAASDQRVKLAEPIGGA